MAADLSVEHQVILGDRQCRASTPTVQAVSGASRRLRILHVAPSFWPAVALGGPIYSTKSLCDHIARDPGIELRILTTDAAGLSVPERLNLEENPAIFEAGYTVRYCRRVALASVAPGLLARLPDAIRWSDVVHLTATYSFPTLPTLALCRALKRPVVWSPRGGLQATAQWIEAPKRRVKQRFEQLCQVVRPRDTVLHVTAPMEAETSCERLPGIRTAVIPNSIDLPAVPEQHTWRPDGRLRLMFISRLHEKKGLEVLIDALARLPSHVTLDVYGVGTPAYEASLRAQVSRQHLDPRVTFHGHVEGEAKTRAFLDADLFCLSTWSENFGLVVGEALAHGIPAITTRGAPWEGLIREGCGLWIETGVEPLVVAINAMETADLAEMGRRGRAWMERDFSPETVAERMLELYRSLPTGRTPEPRSSSSCSIR